MAEREDLETPQEPFGPLLGGFRPPALPLGLPLLEMAEEGDLETPRVPCGPY